MSGIKIDANEVEPDFTPALVVSGVGVVIMLVGIVVAIFASGSTSLVCERQTGYCELEKWSLLDGSDLMRFPIEDLEEARVVAHGIEHTTYGVEVMVAGRTRLITQSGTGSRSPRVRIVDSINIFIRGEGPDTLIFQEGNTTLGLAFGFALSAFGFAFLPVGAWLYFRQPNAIPPRGV